MGDTPIETNVDCIVHSGANFSNLEYPSSDYSLFVRAVLRRFPHVGGDWGQVPV